MSDDKLPEPPLRVYAREGDSPRRPQWWTFYDGQTWMNNQRDECFSSELRVIPHPANDAEAIEIIQNARKGE